MTYAVYLPLLVCATLCVGARPLAARLSPGVGAWTLTTAALIGAVSGVWTLGLLVASLIDDVPWLADGQPPLPVNDAISFAAAGILGWSAIRLGRELRRQQALRRELRAMRALPGDDLVVLPDARALAFALPGRPGHPGRIVVTDTMLRALTVTQRRVLIAHERAHLDAHHSAALILGQLAAAANPMLIPVARAAAYLCERHADERAAEAVGDRRLAATAVAAAALAALETTPSRQSPAGLLAPGFHDLAVIDRISALHTTVTRTRRLTVVTAAIAIMLTAASTAHATTEFVQLATAFLTR